MLPFLLQRLVGFAVTLAVASVLVFSALEVLPGDAAEVVLGTGATPQALAALRQRLGLDQPALARYGHWVGGLLQGQTAASLSYGQSTAELLGQRLSVTLPLAALALLLTLGLALASGLYAALHAGRWRGSLVMALTQLGMAVPSFWVAIGLILLFAVKLQWVSAGGFPGWSGAEGGGLVHGLVEGLAALLLPALSLALVQAAILARVTRAAVLDVQQEDFVRTARAKGLSRGLALRRHVLRNALIPVLTVAGLQFANLVTGTIVVENVFVLPGIGRLMFQAVANRDLVVVRDGVLLLAALVLLVNLLVDLVVALVDPRLRRR